MAVIAAATQFSLRICSDPKMDARDQTPCVKARALGECYSTIRGLESSTTGESYKLIFFLFLKKFIYLLCIQHSASMYACTPEEGAKPHYRWL